MLLLNAFYSIFMLIKMSSVSAYFSSFLIFVCEALVLLIYMSTEQRKSVHILPEDKFDSLKIIKLLFFKEN